VRLLRPWIGGRRVALILMGLLLALAVGLGVMRGSLSRLTDGTAAPPTSSPAITASATGR
jgi:hypothetical protein